MVAVNILPQRATLEEWKAFFRYVGGGDQVLFAEDTDGRAVVAFDVRALGTTVIINRKGRVVYRDGGATPYATLRAEVDKVL